ncbi:MAG: hypothetical protein WB495_02345 [Xanthobacteraceae bacterium]
MAFSPENIFVPNEHYASAVKELVAAFGHYDPESKIRELLYTRFGIMPESVADDVLKNSVEAAFISPRQDAECDMDAVTRTIRSEQLLPQPDMPGGRLVAETSKPEQRGKRASRA